MSGRPSLYSYSIKGEWHMTTQFYHGQITALALALMAIMLGGIVPAAHADIEGDSSRNNQEYWERRMYDQAIADCIQTIGHDPRYAASYTAPDDGNKENISRNAAGTDGYDRSMAIRERANKIHPQPNYLYETLGSNDHFNRAFTDCTQAVEFDPRYAPAYVMRGAGYEGTGQYERAITEYEKARELYSKALDRDPLDAVAYYGRGLADHKMGQRDYAITDYNKAIALDPHNVNAYVGRALAHHETGQIEAALADYNKALQLDPRNVNAYIGRGNAHIEEGQLMEAIADYGRAIEFDPQNSYAYGARGNAYEKIGQFERALADCTRAIKLNPREAAAYIVRGNIYDDRGQPGRAIADYKRALELNHRDFDAYNALAWIKATTIEPRYRNGQEAVRLARRALELKLKPADRAEVLDTLAAAYVANGEFDRALEHYEEAMEAGGRMRVVLYQQELKAKGRYRGHVDGTYSTGTRKALAACIQAGCQLGVE